MGEPLQTSHTATEHQVPALSVALSPHLSANLVQRGRQAPSPFCRLSLCYLSLSVLARLCQSHRLILGIGWLSAMLWPLLLSHSFSFICLPSSATEPKVCLFFLTGDVRAERDAAAPLSLCLSLAPSLCLPQRLIWTTGWMSAAAYCC